MVIIAYSGEEDKKEYLKKNLELAKMVLKELPNLNKLLDNFKDFENYNEIDNVFFWTCSYPLRESIFGNPLLVMQELREFDNILNSMVMNSELINRARTNRYEQSQSLYSELKLFNYLKKKYGINFTIYPKINNKEPEGLLKIDSQEIYLEQTSLMIGETERKLKEVFKRIAKNIYINLNRDTLISMHIDANKIKWKPNGGMDIDEATSHLWESIQKINLIPFFNIKNSDTNTIEWRPHIFNNIGSGKLIDHLAYLDSYDDLGLFLSENRDKEPSKSFLNNTIEDIKTCPVESFFSLPSKYPLVEIQTNLIFPSEAANSEFKSIKQRINNKIKNKLIEQDQFPEGKVNLLLIEADIWMLFGYIWKEDPQIQELIQNINQLLNEIKNTKLSSIIIYGRNLLERIIVPNPHAIMKISEEEINEIL